jgi:hypothetical protein
MPKTSRTRCVALLRTHGPGPLCLRSASAGAAAASAPGGAQSEEELKAGEAPDEEGEAELKLHTSLGKKCAPRPAGLLRWKPPLPVRHRMAAATALRSVAGTRDLGRL